MSASLSTQMTSHDVATWLRAKSKRFIEIADELDCAEQVIEADGDAVAAVRSLLTRNGAKRIYEIEKETGLPREQVAFVVNGPEFVKRKRGWYSLIDPEP